DISANRAIGLCCKYRIVSSRSTHDPGIQQLQRHADFFLAESAACFKHLPNRRPVLQLDRPDQNAHFTCCSTNRFHVHPASCTARWIPTPGPSSGFGFTSSTRGLSAESSRISTRR